VKLNDFPSLCELDLDLADPPTSGPGAIDILICSDWYWNIVGGEVIRMNGGPTAVWSKLGWLLSGTVSSDASSHLVSSHLALCHLAHLSQWIILRLYLNYSGRLKL